MSNPLKIILINTDDRMGGAAIACVRLQKSLEQYQNLKVRFLTQENKSKSLIISEIADTRFKKQKAFFRFILERLYFRLFEKNKEVRFAFSPANVGIDISQHPLVQEADVIHFHWTNFGFLSLDSIQKLINLNKPIIWTMHDMWLFTGGCHHSGDCENYQFSCGNCVQYLKSPSETDLSNQVWSKKNTIFNLLRQPANSHQIQLVACSNWLADRAKKSSLFQNYLINSIPNPIDIELFRPINKAEARQKLGLPTNKKLILFVAMKVSVLWKGFGYFEESLTILNKNSANTAINLQKTYQFEDIELLILGESDKELVEKLPFKSNAFGRISDFEKIAMLYAAADVFVIPSIQENLPNTIMEALACGTPAVGFDVGGIPEMIEHKKTGFLAKYKSAESLAEGISWVLDLEASDYQQLADQCRTKVVENYSEAIVAQKYKNLYNAAIES